MNPTRDVIENIVRNYFSAFSSKDLSRLKQIFAINICLRDWEIIGIGYDEVCRASQKIFDSVSTINVEPVNIYVDGLIAIGDLIITIDGKETIRVVDILEFNRDLKIISIKAYKG